MEWFLDIQQKSMQQNLDSTKVYYKQCILILYVKNAIEIKDY